jgi:hypothetical protein
MTMFLIYISYREIAGWVFGVGLLLLLLSLAFLIKEIQISTKALQHHIEDIEEFLS